MTGTLQILTPHQALTDVLLPPVKEKLAATGGVVGGDIKMMWDSENETEVDLARQQFDAAIKKGMAGFRVTKKGEKAEQIRRFDPMAEARDRIRQVDAHRRLVGGGADVHRGGRRVDAARGDGGASVDG